MNFIQDLNIVSQQFGISLLRQGIILILELTHLSVFKEVKAQIIDKALCSPRTSLKKLSRPKRSRQRDSTACKEASNLIQVQKG